MVRKRRKRPRRLGLATGVAAEEVEAAGEAGGGGGVAPTAWGVGGILGTPAGAASMGEAGDTAPSLGGCGTSPAAWSLVVPGRTVSSALRKSAKALCACLSAGEGQLDVWTDVRMGWTHGAVEQRLRGNGRGARGAQASPTPNQRSAKHLDRVTEGKEAEGR